MAEDWKELQSSIAADLKSDGQEFSFTRLAREDFDPIKGAYVGETKKQFTAYGIFRSLGTVSLSSSYSFHWQPETTIALGDKLLLLECSTYEPQHGDLLSLDGEDWVVAAWAYLDPSGLPLLQYLLVRRA